MFWTGERGTLEDGEHTGRPRTGRSEHKAQEVATLVRASCSQTEQPAVATVLAKNSA
jgi:hypothetical protein